MAVERIAAYALEQLQFDQFVSEQFKRPAFATLWWSGPGERKQVRLDVAGDFGPDRSARSRLFGEGGLQALLQETVPNVLDRAPAAEQGVGDLLVGALLALAAIREQQD